MKVDKDSPNCIVDLFFYQMDQMNASVWEEPSHGKRIGPRREDHGRQWATLRHKVEVPKCLVVVCFLRSCQTWCVLWRALGKCSVLFKILAVRLPCQHILVPQEILQVLGKKCTTNQSQTNRCTKKVKVSIFETWQLHELQLLIQCVCGKEHRGNPWVDVGLRHDSSGFVFIFQEE